MERHFRTEALSFAMITTICIIAFFMYFKEAIITVLVFCLALVALYFLAIGAMTFFAIINWHVVFFSVAVIIIIGFILFGLSNLWD